MRTRFLTLTTALLAACCSNAHALSIGGWGVSINSPLHVTVDLRGVPNPYTQPTITKVQATLDQLEYYCFNPQNYSVAPGKAGQLTVSGADQVKAEDILGKGQATVGFIFQIDDNLQCVNPLWNYLEGSAAAKIVTVNIDYYFCSGDVKTDPDPCFDGEELTIEEKKAATTVSGVCTLNPVERDKDYVPISGQVYDCVQTSP